MLAGLVSCGTVGEDWAQPLPDSGGLLAVWGILWLILRMSVSRCALLRRTLSVSD